MVLKVFDINIFLARVLRYSHTTRCLHIPSISNAWAETNFQGSSFVNCASIFFSIAQDIIVIVVEVVLLESILIHRLKSSCFFARKVSLLSIANYFVLVCIVHYHTEFICRFC